MNITLPFNISGLNISLPSIFGHQNDTNGTSNCRPVDWMGNICQTDMYIVMVLVGSVVLFLGCAFRTVVLYCMRFSRPFWHWKLGDLQERKITASTLKRMEEKNHNLAEYFLVDMKRPLLECQECGRICNLSSKDFPASRKELFHFCNSETTALMDREYVEMPELPICSCQMKLRGGGKRTVIRPSDLAEVMKDDDEAQLKETNEYVKIQQQHVETQGEDDEEAEDAEDELEKEGGDTYCALDEEEAIDAGVSIAPQPTITMPKRKTQGESTMLPLHWEQMLEIRIQQLVGSAHVQWDLLPKGALRIPELWPGKFNIAMAIAKPILAAYNAWTIYYAWIDLAVTGKLTGYVNEHWAFLAKCQIWFEFILLGLTMFILEMSVIEHWTQFKSKGICTMFILATVTNVVDLTFWLNINSMYFLPILFQAPFILSLFGIDRRRSKYRPLRLVDKQSKSADRCLYWGSLPFKIALILVTFGAFVLKVYRLAISGFINPIGTWGLSVYNLLIQLVLNLYTLMEGAANRNSALNLLRGSIHTRTPFFYLLKTANLGCKSILRILALWLMLPPVQLYYLFVWNAWYRVLDTIPPSFASAEAYFQSLEATGKNGAVYVDVALCEIKNFVSKFPTFAEHEVHRKKAMEIFTECVKNIPDLGTEQSAAVELQRATKEALQAYREHFEMLGFKGDLLFRNGLRKAFERAIKAKRNELRPANFLSRKLIRATLEDCLNNPEDSVVLGYQADGGKKRLVGLNDGQFFCDYKGCGDLVSTGDKRDSRRFTQDQMPPDSDEPPKTKERIQCNNCKTLQSHHGKLKNIISSYDLRLSLDRFIEELPEYGRHDDLLDCSNDWKKIKDTFEERLEKKIFTGLFGRSTVTYKEFVDKISKNLFKFERAMNKAKCPVVLGEDGKLRCGRITKDLCRSVEDSDGRCGPDDGEQCQDCKATTIPEGSVTRATLANGLLLVLGFYSEGDANRELSREVIKSAFNWWRQQEDHDLDMHTFILDRRSDITVCNEGICRKPAEYHCAWGCDFHLCKKHRFASKSFYHMVGDAPFCPRRYKEDNHFHCGGMAGLHPERDTILRCKPNPECKECPKCIRDDRTTYLCDNCQCIECYRLENAEEEIVNRMREAVKLVKMGVPDVSPWPPKKISAVAAAVARGEPVYDYADFEVMMPQPTPTPELKAIISM